MLVSVFCVFTLNKELLEEPASVLLISTPVSTVLTHDTHTPLP